MNENRKAYDEFVAGKCEEISNNDSEYQKLMMENINNQKALKKALSDFENSTAKMQAYAESLMLRSSIYTAQNTAQKIINHD